MTKFSYNLVLRGKNVVGQIAMMNEYAVPGQIYHQYTPNTQIFE